MTNELPVTLTIDELHDLAVYAVAATAAAVENDPEVDIQGGTPELHAIAAEAVASFTADLPANRAAAARLAGRTA